MQIVNKLEKSYDRNLILIFEEDKNYCEYISQKRGKN